MEIIKTVIADARTKADPHMRRSRILTCRQAGFTMVETIVAIVFIASMIALITALSCLVAVVYLATIAFRHEW